MDREKRSGEGSIIGLLPQSPLVYYRTPRLGRDENGNVTLYVLAWKENVEQLQKFLLSESGELLGEPEVIQEQPAIAGLDHVWSPRVSSTPRSELGFEKDSWKVFIRGEADLYSVIVSPPDGRQIIVWREIGIAAAPTLALSGGGVWVAFHHNVREDDGLPDVAKWIALRYVSADGDVFEPVDPMTDRNRDQLGEEQSFEFPALEITQEGAVSLFGRGSHCFWRQNANNLGFSNRIGFTPSSWGCRGRRVATLTLKDGSILTARREREGIELRHHSPPSGGAPALKPIMIRKGSKRHLSITPTSSTASSFHGMRVFFGDIHQHSAHSDGIGTADETYTRARYFLRDDFCALTDHESFLGKRIGRGEWAYLESVAEAHHEPGTFVTLHAYEWTAQRHPGPGHKVVYWPQAACPIISRDTHPQGEALLSAVKEHSGIAVPHHTGWTGADANAHDESIQPVWEICSCHGCYETWDHSLGQRGELRDQTAFEMLKQGLRFGFIACSDSHGLLWHHGIARKRDPFRTGLTAVQATECTREAIFDALKSRRCYATSGPKIFLDVRANGEPMGSAIDSEAPTKVRVETIGVEPIASIELVSAEGVCARKITTEKHLIFETEVQSKFVYARITQTDGEMAWSSPIFFKQT